LLKEAGLSYQKPGCSAAESDGSEQEEFRDELKKSDGKRMPR
jgi:transposase